MLGRYSRLIYFLLIIVFCFAVVRIAVTHEPTYQANPSYQQSDEVSLGHALFFDRSLSRDGSVSCSSCHQQEHAFTDGRSTSIGVGKQPGTRNAPSLSSLFEGEPLFWDGRRDQLALAVLDPLVNKLEMGNSSLGKVIQKISERSAYQVAFAHTYPGAHPLSQANIGAALSAYIRSVEKKNSPYDDFLAGNTNALTPQQLEGLRLFQGKAQCATCHSLKDSNFSDGKFHHSGVGFNGLNVQLGQLTMSVLQHPLDVATMGDSVEGNNNLSALGRFLVTHRAVDAGTFRTPSLRNVAVTAPYMHDGSVRTLDAAVDMEVYYRGLVTGPSISLTSNERRDILVFLESLTNADVVTVSQTRSQSLAPNQSAVKMPQR